MDVNAELVKALEVTNLFLLYEARIYEERGEGAAKPMMQQVESNRALLARIERERGAAEMAA